MVLVQFVCPDCKSKIVKALNGIPIDPDYIMTFDCERCHSTTTLTVQEYNFKETN